MIQTNVLYNAQQLTGTASAATEKMSAVPQCLERMDELTQLVLAKLEGLSAHLDRSVLRPAYPQAAQAAVESPHEAQSLLTARLTALNDRLVSMSRMVDDIESRLEV